MIRSESIVNIAAALVKAQKDMGNAVKDSNNPFFKSKFADLNSVREAVTPSLHANGISVLQLNAVIDGKQYVETTLLHETGEYICSFTEVVSKDAGNPQAHGSAISYARRYGLSSMLSVGTEDDDGESAMKRSSKTITAQSITVKDGSSSATTKLVEATPLLAPISSAKPASGFGTFRKK